MCGKRDTKPTEGAFIEAVPRSNRFDLGELEKILEQESIETLRNEIDNNEGHDEKRGKCPRCGGTGNMVRVTSLKDADIHIDTCSVCYGQWLDGGEIEHLKDHGVIERIKKILR